jgi:hypothetical protein
MKIASISLAAFFAAASICTAAEPDTGKPDEKDIEFRINGEAFGKKAMSEALADIPSYDPKVCPTDMSAGWEMRRTRLIRYVPIRQFLDKEGIEVTKEEIEAEIERMKKDPNPFGKAPPKPVCAVMVRDCITWSDLRLMLRVDIGMEKWVEKQWKEKWPTENEWKEYCTQEEKGFGESYGKFGRLSFSISKWPKGAKDEADALRILKERADAAAKKLSDGGKFEEVAKDPAVAGEIASTQILPYRALGPDHTETLKNLPVGGTTEPVKTPFSWEIIRREKLTPEDLSEALKLRFLMQLRMEAQQKVASEAKIEKVNWMTPDDLRHLGSGM